jgi:hypothetical protein
MAAPPLDVSEIDAAMQAWRQGDLVIDGVPFFLHLADLARPLTPEARAAVEAGPPPAGDNLVGVASQPRGLVVVTQTCDVVRPSANRPFVELSPLVEVDAAVLEHVRKLRRPRYVYLPGVADLRLVADLDQTMTAEKAILARVARVPGCRDDKERRAFADALARKRARFAFPDDFTRAFRGVERRLKEKHGRDSGEGALARALREIRVRAAPGWDDPQVRLTFLFVLEVEEPPPTQRDQEQVEDWLRRFDGSGRFRPDPDLPWLLCFLEDLDAREYVESDRLDLDDLSQR